MITYQEKTFREFVEKFKREELSEAKKIEIKINEWRKSFVTEYPRNSINSMSMDNYIISSKRLSNNKSFCRRICSELETTFHVCLGNKWEETFGIVFKNGTQLTLSNNFFVKFDRNYDKAFAYIKNEIINLLDAIDKDNYAAVESCDIPSYFKYMLLIIYFPEKVLPVCQESLLYRYCEKLYITNDSNKEMIYINNMLINWKNDVPEIADWSNEIFTSFCDWLYRKNLTIDGNMLRKDARINMSRITEEIDGLNLQGKTKEAVVKVRVNQRIFRDKLLRYYNKCCLCDIDNKNLLVASHIKPWSESESNEKLDSDNGFLMCPNHDKLFDQGWITFDDDGNIVIADRLSERDRNALNIKANMKISLTEKNKTYLQYHRKNKFKNT